MNDLFVLPVAGGAGRRVARVHGDFRGMSWTADGASLVYASDGDLWQAALAGGPPEKLLAGGDAAMPAISRDGHRLAYGRSGVLQREHLAGGAGSPDPGRRSAREVDRIQPDAAESRVLARWPPGGVRVHPVGNALKSGSAMRTVPTPRL